MENHTNGENSMASDSLSPPPDEKSRVGSLGDESKESLESRSSPSELSEASATSHDDALSLDSEEYRKTEPSCKTNPITPNLPNGTVASSKAGTTAGGNSSGNVHSTKMVPVKLVTVSGEGNVRLVRVSPVKQKAPSEQPATTAGADNSKTVLLKSLPSSTTISATTSKKQAGSATSSASTTPSPTVPSSPTLPSSASSSQPSLNKQKQSEQHPLVNGVGGSNHSSDGNGAAGKNSTNNKVSATKSNNRNNDPGESRHYSKNCHFHRVICFLFAISASTLAALGESITIIP